MPHPNASVAAGGTGLAALIVWVASLLHVTLTAYDGLAIAGGLGTIILFIGRNGLAGVWGLLKHGTGVQAPPAA